MNRTNFPDKKDRRRKEAIARQEAYNKLTSTQKLQRLDKMFGEGKGGTNERARLNNLLRKETEIGAPAQK